MAKEPVFIPARPDQRDPTPQRRPFFFSIGGQRYKIKINTKITRIPGRSAQVIPIDRKSGDKTM